MDYQHVLQVFSKNPANKMSIPDFDIMVRGWNPAMALLLPRVGSIHGIPLMESTTKSRNIAVTVLHRLGRFSLLKQVADMVLHGLADGAFADERIVVKLSKRTSIHHFLEVWDREKLEDVESATRSDWTVADAGPLEDLVDRHKIDNLEARIEALVFPRETHRGTMIGYRSEPDIENHFLSLVMKETLDWRNEAGIHPDTDIGGVPGSDVAAIGSLLTSLYLKHIRFVDVGKRKVPEANYPMSLTIWKPESDLIESISKFTGIAAGDVARAVDLFILRPDDYAYFKSEQTPFIPMLIKISDEYVLSPVSSIFRNPLHGIRMFQESLTRRAENSVRKPR
jgi:hypothetical protein